MLPKIIVVLFFLGAALGYYIQDTPEELREIFQNIDDQVKILEHEAMIEIRDTLMLLQKYVDQARTDIVINITSTAEPYWAKIKSLEETAAQQGQNVQDCINLGNNQIYALNNSIVLVAYDNFEYYRKLGNDIITSSSTVAYSVIQELLALEQVVAACTDDTCATELRKTVTQYYARAKGTITDAETKSSNYVLVYLPVLLTKYSLDANSYVANYTVYLNDVTDCINNL